MATVIFDGPEFQLIENVSAAGRAVTLVAKPGSTYANRDTMTAKATAAIAANSTFLANASPTAAVQLTQLRLLTRENTALIRLLLGLLDSAADT